MTNPPIPQLVEELISLQRAYSKEYRCIVTEERFDNLITSDLISDYTWDSTYIREPLIEHVGHLPIIASFIYPHIEHAEDVALGRSLIMLSIHDIGETKVGDIQAYKKTEKHENAERNAARALLPKKLVSYFDELEAFETYDAKFAKAVDTLAPIIHEAIMPEITPARFKHHGFNIDTIIKHKRHHCEWDSVLIGVFDHLIDQYRKMNI